MSALLSYVASKGWLGSLLVYLAFNSSAVEARDVATVGPDGRLVTDAFFGMHVRYGATKTLWPDVRFYGWRVITPGTAWFGLQPKKEQWNFTELDRAVEIAEQHGIEILLTLGQTPKWAAARPDEFVPNGARIQAPIAQNAAHRSALPTLIGGPPRGHRTADVCFGAKPHRATSCPNALSS